MTTLVNKAVTAMVDALTRVPAVAANVDRVRLRPVAQNVPLAVAVRPIQTEVKEAALAPGYPVSWETTISVECYARSGASTSPDLAVDALVESVYSRLMEDTSLAGAVIALRPTGVSYDFDADGDHTVCASLVFIAHQRAVGSTFT